jgi:hypothetical protein
VQRAAKQGPLTFERCLPGFSLLLHESVDEFDNKQLLATGQHGRLLESPL